MVQWDGTTQELPITVKELLPILLAGILLGKSWRSHRVLRQPSSGCLHSLPLEQTQGLNAFAAELGIH